MTSSRRYAVFALAVYLLLYIFPLWGRPLFVPDESRYGEIPREMIADGDFVVPHLDGLRYFEKPVLAYWVHAGAIMIFGENRFALRLPSALAVGLTGLIIFFLLRRLLPRPDDGVLPPLALAVFFTSSEVMAVGTFAVLDSLLALFLTVVVAAFFLATESSPGSARERFFLLFAGVACGLAFLTKGVLALAVPVVVFVPYLLWERRWRDIFRLAWLPLASAVVVALPWAVAINAREPGFWHYFFWVEHVKRFLARDAQHGKPFWFYFAAAPLLFIPWSFVVPAFVSGLRSRLFGEDRQGRLIRFALCWFFGPFLFFSIAHGKLLTYILPCFPPFAVLAALALGRAGGRRDRFFSWGAYGLGGLFAGLTVVFLWAQIHGINDFHPYTRTWKWLMAANSLAFFSFFAILAGRRYQGAERILFLAIAPLLFLASINFIMPDLTIAKKAPEALLFRHRRDIGSQTIIISGEEPLTTACFVFARDDIFVLDGPGELAYGLGFPDAAGRHLDPAAAAVMITANPGRVVLTARGRNYRRWRQVLPPPRVVDDNGPDGYVFVRY